MKRPTFKTLFLAASLAAVFVSGCAGLGGTTAATGASAQEDTSATKAHSPYPAETDAGLF